MARRNVQVILDHFSPVVPRHLNASPTRLFFGDPGGVLRRSLACSRGAIMVVTMTVHDFWAFVGCVPTFFAV